MCAALCGLVLRLVCTQAADLHYSNIDGPFLFGLGAHKPRWPPMLPALSLSLGLSLALSLGRSAARCRQTGPARRPPTGSKGPLERASARQQSVLVNQSHLQATQPVNGRPKPSQAKCVCRRPDAPKERGPHARPTERRPTVFACVWAGSMWAPRSIYLRLQVGLGRAWGRDAHLVDESGAFWRSCIQIDSSFALVNHYLWSAARKANWTREPNRRPASHGHWLTVEA